MTNARRAGQRPGRFKLVAVLFVPVVFPSPVYPVDEPERGIDLRFLEEFHQLASLMGRSDWEEESAHIKQSLDNIWRRNGWTDEADRFARDVACEVAAVPPWEPMKRLGLLNKRIAERYGLADDEAIRFQSAVMREITRHLTRNAGAILQPVREWMQARVNGKPFTPEQVARWAKESKPLLAELSDSGDRLRKELEPMVEPSKRHLLERDLKSVAKRSRFTEAMMARWAQGKWQPADWGMEDDPIQTAGGALAREAPAPSDRKTSALRDPREAAKIPQPLPHDPSTWFAYVLEFQKRFGLDAGQMSTAESILSELRARAESYAAIHADTLQVVPVRERAAHDAFEPIRILFGELQARLDTIPTSTQRNREPP